MSAELEAYRKLHDGLSDMIESGRLEERDIPDDYKWLVDSLADIPAPDPVAADQQKRIEELESKETALQKSAQVLTDTLNSREKRIAELEAAKEYPIIRKNVALQERVAELEARVLILTESNNQRGDANVRFRECYKGRIAELEKQVLDQGWVMNRAANRIAELEAAGERLKIFAAAYRSHPLREGSDCLNSAIFTWEQALKGGTHDRSIEPT